MDIACGDNDDTKQNEECQPKEISHFENAMCKIKKITDTYGGNGEVEDIKIQIPKYKTEEMDWEKIDSLHLHLTKMDNNVDKLKLIIKYELGKLYTVMQKKVKSEDCTDVSKWFLEKYGLSYKRVIEHINFYKLITAYPLLLLSEVTYSTFVRNGKKILKAIEDDENLNDKLNVPVSFKYNDKDLYEIEVAVNKMDIDG